MDEILLEVEEKMKKSIESLEKRFINIRAGRANPAILDGIMVSYYGTDTPLKQLANISVLLFWIRYLYYVGHFRLD